MNTITNTLLRDHVYEAIRTEIVMGRIKPGDKLNIANLAGQMNVSFAPVREALNMLSKDGLVELVPHKQPVVTSGDYQDYLIIVDLRIMLEPYAAHLSVDKIPQEKIDETLAQLYAVLENPNNVDAYIASDLKLHKLLHAYVPSSLLSSMIDMITNYNMRYRYLNDRQSNLQEIIISTQEHIAIANALDSRDPDAAYTAVRQHIEHYNERNIQNAQSEFNGGFPRQDR